MSWMTATALTGCTITGYLFFRYTWCLALETPVKILLFLFFMFLGCLPLLVGYHFEKYLGNFYTMYRYTLYFLFVFCVILFTLTLISDAVFGVICYTTTWLRNVGGLGCWWFKYGNILLAFLFSVYALYAGTKVPAIKEVVFSSPKISEERKIVVLSDIHIHRAVSPSKIEGIVNKTNALDPDVILLVGDTLDDIPSRVQDITKLLHRLQAKEGVYFVSGNHDFYIGYQEAVSELKKQGLVSLENKGVSVTGNIYIGGVSDVRTSARHGLKTDIKSIFEKAKPEQYKILMSHTPIDFGDENNFDLEVSGHTHGGQIFPFHILAKLYNQFLFGSYRLKNGAKIYVSRGAGQWGPQMRLFAPSEITLIKLQPEK